MKIITSVIPFVVALAIIYCAYIGETMCVSVFSLIVSIVCGKRIPEGGRIMSVILAIPISMLFMLGGMKLNISPDFLVLIMAIIFAGGLAGYKE